MTFTPLQWLGPELARSGLIRNDDWIEDHVQRAVALFPNQGLHVAATLLASLHPRAIDYLEQAPVLALAASFGVKLDRKRDRAYVAMNFLPVVNDGRRLRDAMAAFRVAYPLRAVSGNALRPGVWNVLQAITKLVDPSSISQAIPSEPTKHLHWLGGLEALWATLNRRGVSDPSMLRWAMLALSRRNLLEYAHGTDPAQIADFLICNRETFNPRWTWERIVRETAQWHEALANAQIDQINDGKYDAEVDYGLFPDEASVGGYEFHALRSLRALIVEGKAMHHCVASYYRDIQSGRCRIYSVRKDGRRVATAEVSAHPTIRIAQLKGVCNAAPAKAVRAASDRFVKNLPHRLKDGVRVYEAQLIARRGAA